MQVTAHNSLRIAVEAGESTVLFNRAGGDTVYYGPGQEVSATSNTGSVAPGGSAVLTAPTYIVSAGFSDVDWADPEPIQASTGVNATADAAVTSVLNRINATHGAFRLATSVPSVLTDAQAAIDAATLSMLVVQTDQAAYARKVKALNRNVMVGVYKNFGHMIDSTFADGSTSTGLRLSKTPASWTLKNGSTALFNTSFTFLFCADVGNAGYTDAWATATIAEAKGRGFDFVFADDVNHQLHGQLTSDLYPTDVLYQEAVQKGIARIAPRFRAAGLMLMPNIGGWHDGAVTNAPDHGDAIAAMCGGGVHEQYSSFGYPPTVQTWLNNIINSALLVHQAGGLHVGVGHGAATNTAIARLGLAMDLLCMQGPQPAVSGMHGPDLATSYAGPIITFPAEQAVADAIGTPVFPAFQPAGTYWKRVFTNGTVLVNSTGSSQTIALGGTYSSAPAGIVSQSSVTMPAATGLVLQKG